MTITTSQRVCPSAAPHLLRLRPMSAAPRRARRLVREVCAGRGLPSWVVDDAALIVSELVTTSVRQSHAAVDVEVTVTAEELTVRVYDDSTVPPVGQGCEQDAQRSWAMVRRLGTSWGYHCGADGRQLWASLRSRANQPIEFCS
jgi:hypothetical protein